MFYDVSDGVQHATTEMTQLREHVEDGVDTVEDRPGALEDAVEQANTDETAVTDTDAYDESAADAGPERLGPGDMAFGD